MLHELMYSPQAAFFTELFGTSVRYTGASVVQVFFITAAAFGGLSLYGYTTRKSLSGIGSFLVMGLIGLILASLVNIFLASSGLAFAISLIGGIAGLLAGLALVRGLA